MNCNYILMIKVNRKFLYNTETLLIFPKIKECFGFWSKKRLLHHQQISVECCVRDSLSVDFSNYAREKRTELKISTFSKLRLYSLASVPYGTVNVCIETALNCNVLYSKITTFGSNIITNAGHCSRKFAINIVIRSTLAMIVVTKIDS